LVINTNERHERRALHDPAKGECAQRIDADTFNPTATRVATVMPRKNFFALAGIWCSPFSNPGLADVVSRAVVIAGADGKPEWRGGKYP
jgi:hypothetical protein